MRKKTSDTMNGYDLYEKETSAGKRVFTLRAARRYNMEQLQCVIDFMLEEKKLQASGTEKDAYSFRNVMHAMKEKSAPPTEEELKASQEIYDVIQEKNKELVKAYGEKVETQC